MIAMWTVELVVHHLDLAVHLPALAPPADGGLDLVKATLDRLTAGSCPKFWDIETYALKGTGRITVTPSERAKLASRAELLPAFG